MSLHTATAPTARTSTAVKAMSMYLWLSPNALLMAIRVGIPIGSLNA